MHCASVLAHGTREERHAVRIAAKKMRYAAEFFAGLFPRKRARSYLKKLTGLQDVLGRFNDGVTATRLAHEIDREGETAAVGIARGWAAAQAAALEPELAAAHERFERAKRFWS
jgi:CHAD domain-containing protein